MLPHLILFVINSDTSVYGDGAVITQNQHSFSYFSKAMGSRFAVKSAYEAESIAIFLAIIKWRYYLI